MKITSLRIYFVFKIVIKCNKSIHRIHSRSLDEIETIVNKDLKVKISIIQKKFKNQNLNFQKGYLVRKTLKKKSKK